MRKIALALAATAMLGMVAPAFAVESGTATQTRTPVAQGSVNPSAKVKTDAKGLTKVDHRRRVVDKVVQHDRGLRRGFTHSRHYGYAKTHGRPARA